VKNPAGSMSTMSIWAHNWNPYTTWVPPPDSMICFNTFTYTLFWLTLCRMVLGHIRYQIMCID
jgi:hypothetical protein